MEQLTDEQIEAAIRAAGLKPSGPDFAMARAVAAPRLEQIKRRKEWNAHPCDSVERLTNELLAAQQPAARGQGATSAP